MSFNDKRFDNMLKEADMSIQAKSRIDVNKKLVKLMNSKKPKVIVLKVLKFNRKDYEILVRLR